MSRSEILPNRPRRKNQENSRRPQVLSEAVAKKIKLARIARASLMFLFRSNFSAGNNTGNDCDNNGVRRTDSTGGNTADNKVWRSIDTDNSNRTDNIRSNRDRTRY
jgi:hypothetical protein